MAATEDSQNLASAPVSSCTDASLLVGHACCTRHILRTRDCWSVTSIFKQSAESIQGPSFEPSTNTIRGEFVGRLGMISSLFWNVLL